MVIANLITREQAEFRLPDIPTVRERERGEGGELHLVQVNLQVLPAKFKLEAEIEDRIAIESENYKSVASKKSLIQNN